MKITVDAAYKTGYPSEKAVLFMLPKDEYTVIEQEYDTEISHDGGNEVYRINLKADGNYSIRYRTSEGSDYTYVTATPQMHVNLFIDPEKLLKHIDGILEELVYERGGDDGYEHEPFNALTYLLRIMSEDKDAENS